MNTNARHRYLFAAAAMVSLIGACSRNGSTMPPERIRGGMTLQQAEEAMGGPGRNAADMVAPEETDTSPKLKQRLQRIMKDETHGRDPSATVIVWREKRGEDEWIRFVDFKDGKALGSGGCWLRLPDE